MSLRWYFLLRRGFDRVDLKCEKREIKGCGATFTQLNTFRGDCKEGVWYDQRVEIKDLWLIKLLMISLKNECFKVIFVKVR